MRTNNEHLHLGPRHNKPLKITAAAIASVGILRELNQAGITITQDGLEKMIAAYKSGAIAQDSFTQPITTPSITTPVQFLQAWLPGFVHVITQARKIDKLVGITTVGSWEDEEIVQGVMELVGGATPYSDYGNVPMSSWNVNWETRSIVRFEEGMRVSILEEKRAAKIRVNSAESKRNSAALALEINRNTIGFYGYNGGQNRTYGYLNDPALPAYESVSTGAGGGTEWSTKTFLEITGDIREMISSLRTKSGAQIDPKEVDITLAVSTGSVDYLSVTSDFGNSVQDWLTSTYPRVRVESAPELDEANAGDNVAYMYAETIEDGSTDDNRVFIQAVPTKFITLGVEQRAKEYVEDYSNATAGIMVKRPWAIVRRTGV